jgi:hypothetical protein
VESCRPLDAPAGQDRNRRPPTPTRPPLPPRTNPSTPLSSSPSLWLSSARAGRKLARRPSPSDAATATPELPQVSHRLRLAAMTLPVEGIDVGCPESAPPRLSSPRSAARFGSTPALQASSALTDELHGSRVSSSSSPAPPPSPSASGSPPRRTPAPVAAACRHRRRSGDPFGVAPPPGGRPLPCASNAPLGASRGAPQCHRCSLTGGSTRWLTTVVDCRGARPLFFLLNVF